MNELNIEVANLINSYSEDQIQELILRMRAYADKKLGKGRSNHNGREKLDFVFGVFDKALAGIRNWNSKEYSFEEFVFGVLQSEISDYHEKLKRRTPETKNEDYDESYILDIPVWAEEVTYNDRKFEELDFETQKNHYTSQLKDAGAKELEMFIFECWCEDIYKSSEIAELADVDPSEIYNATKRLKNRRRKLKEIK